MRNANLLLYINLSGEVFYIISHRMKSQKVSEELQRRVYNDLSTCICHPTVIQNILKGSLQTLELSLADVKILMDRIVHSSIMTVNAYSMEKLFELTLIATRYQYTVCQYPTDILIIAINHLEKIRKSITDPVGIQLTENLHKVTVERMKHLDSFTMQGYRYAILTYLGDVRLKMTNLIKLGMQKPSGEFVKNLPDRITRPELRKSGIIEIDEAFRKNSLEEDSDSDSDSNGGFKEEDRVDFDEDGEDLEASGYREYEFDEDDYDFPEDLGCHFDQITLDIDRSERDVYSDDDDEILEVEWAEEPCEHEGTKPMTGSYVIRFNSSRKSSTAAGFQDTVPLDCSLELLGSRNMRLGQSIYDIPGNSDEVEDEQKGPSASSSSSQRFYSDLKQEKEDVDSAESCRKEMKSVVSDPKGMQGLDLCSILLGCNLEESTSCGNMGSPSMRLLQGMDGMGPESLGMLSTSSNSQVRSPIAGVNVIQFDASASRSNRRKAELAKISKEFDLGETSDCEEGDERTKANLFESLLGDE